MLYLHEEIFNYEPVNLEDNNDLNNFEESDLDENNIIMQQILLNSYATNNQREL